MKPECSKSIVQRQCPLDASSQDKLLQSLKNIAARLGKSDDIFLLIHTYTQVYIGKLNETDLPLHTENLEELRLFSAIGELHVWKQDSELLNRLRIDKDTVRGDEKVEEHYIHEECHVMWGTDVGPHGDWSLLKEARGTNIRIPFQISTTDQLPLKYKVCNYAIFDDNGIIQFKDARLCGFVDKDGQPIHLLSDKKEA